MWYTVSWCRRFRIHRYIAAPTMLFNWLELAPLLSLSSANTAITANYLTCLLVLCLYGLITQGYCAIKNCAWRKCGRLYLFFFHCAFFGTPRRKNMHLNLGPFALYGIKFGRLATTVGWFWYKMKKLCRPVCLAKPDTIDMPPCPDNSQEDPQEIKRKLNIISLTSSFVYAKLPHP